MKKVLGITVLALVILSLCSMITNKFKKEYHPPKLSYKADPKVEQIYQPVVHLETDQNGRCSGTVIATNYLITAAHCFEDEVVGKATVTTTLDEAPGLQVVAVLAAMSEKQDIALVTGDFSQFKRIAMVTNTKEVLSLYDALATTGSLIVACGYPWGGDLFCSGGALLGRYEFDFRAAGFIYPGMSGGPVLDAETGTLIGVIVATTADHEAALVIAPTIEVFRSLKVAVEEE